MAMSNQQWYDKSIPFVQELCKVAVCFYTNCDGDYTEDDAYSIVRKNCPRTRRLNIKRYPFVVYRDFVVFHNLELPDDKIGDRNQEFLNRFGHALVQAKLSEYAYRGKMATFDEDGYTSVGLSLRDNGEVNMCDCFRNVYWKDETGSHCAVVQFKKNNYPDYVAQELYGHTMTVL